MRGSSYARRSGGAVKAALFRQVSSSINCFVPSVTMICGRPSPRRSPTSTFSSRPLRTGDSYEAIERSATRGRPGRRMWKSFCPARRIGRLAAPIQVGDVHPLEVDRAGLEFIRNLVHAGLVRPEHGQAVVRGVREEDIRGRGPVEPDGGGRDDLAGRRRGR